MPNGSLDLAISFLKMQPTAAAKELEKLPAEEVAHFLNSVSVKNILPVLEKMLPHFVLKICQLLNFDLCSKILNQMNVNLLTSLIRLTDSTIRKNFLEMLHEGKKMACNLLLNYSINSVGNWMVVDMLTVPHDWTTGDVLKYITSKENVCKDSFLLVVDRDRYLHGYIEILDLIKAKSNVPVTSIIKKDHHFISGRTSLILAIDHPGWTSKDILMVMNRINQLVGVLRYQDLRKGLKDIEDNIQINDENDPILTLGKAYGNSLLEMFNTISSLTWIKK